MGQVRKDDVLTDVLKLIRLQGCVYFLKDFRAPWGMEMDRGRVAQFHVVVRGQCWLKTQGQTLLLSAGDVVMFPLGEPHRLVSDIHVEAISGSDVLAAHRANVPVFAEGQESIRLLCGHCELDREIRHPLFQDLPPVIHIKEIGNKHAGWLDMVAKILIGEMESQQPGASSVIDRLAEVLFVQVLRTYFLEKNKQSGFLGAMRNPQLHLALEVIHDQAHRRMTIVEIARAAGMSRSSLAAKFKQQLGCGPMAYLTRWRMLKARELLQTHDLSTTEVAQEVGYQSEAAFHRAFKREFRLNPRAMRRK